MDIITRKDENYFLHDHCRKISGSRLYEDFAETRAGRLLEALDQVEQNGLDSVRVQFRQIEGKLWEIKISVHRVFYVLIGREEMVVLHAYKKQGQKLPIKERETAIKRMKEVMS